MISNGKESYSQVDALKINPARLHQHAGVSPPRVPPFSIPLSFRLQIPWSPSLLVQLSPSPLVPLSPLFFSSARERIPGTVLLVIFNQICLILEIEMSHNCVDLFFKGGEAVFYQI